MIADSTKDAKANQPINYTLALKRMKQPKLISNTKPDITACLGAWYTWDRILQTGLEGNAWFRLFITFSLSRFRP